MQHTWKTILFAALSVCVCDVQCREQLQALAGLRSQLSFLQAALTQHKQWQHAHKVQEACAEAGRQQEVSLATHFALVVFAIETCVSP